MQIIPAIDIENAKCAGSRFSADPLELALQYIQNGAKYLHVVDLDAALHGTPKNFELIKNIVKTVDCNIEISAGINTVELVQKYYDLKPWQIILSSQIVFNIPAMQKILASFDPEKISIAIDYHQGAIMPRGFSGDSSGGKSLKLPELVPILDGLNFKRYIFTDTSRDGKLNGANVAAAKAFKSLVRGQVICSGGASSTDDILAAKYAGLDGILLGRAILEGKLDLNQALNVKL